MLSFRRRGAARESAPIEEVRPTVAKRTRGSRRDRRRGGRPTIVAPATRPAQPAGIQSAEIDAVGATADAAPVRPTSAPQSSSVSRQSGRLSAAAAEYRYVALDLRRIAAVIGTLLALMLALWLAFDVFRVISL